MRLQSVSPNGARCGGVTDLNYWRDQHLTCMARQWHWVTLAHIQAGLLNGNKAGECGGQYGWCEQLASGIQLH